MNSTMRTGGMAKRSAAMRSGKRPLTCKVPHPGYCEGGGRKADRFSSTGGMAKRSAAMSSSNRHVALVWHRFPTGAHLLRTGLVLALVVSLAPGCSMMSNPFRDDLVNSPPVTTPSADGVRTATVSRVAPQRRFQSAIATPMECAVTHAPLYFEDPSEVIGSDDGNFAWTGEDYWSFLAWRGRFLLNLVLFPVNFAETPIWTTMTSDGVFAPRAPFDELHDAARTAATPVPDGDDASPSPTG